MREGPCSVTVVGGINMDIGGSPAGTLRERDSNPGIVTQRPGGVGRNIAHDLLLMGARVRLLTALGDDERGALLLESCRALGLDMGLSLIRPRERSSTYLYITDERGDMRLAIADMDVIDRISPAALASRMEELDRADALVLDANLSPAALGFLGERSRAPLYADPVSAAKAPRLEPLLPRLRLLKPNRLEAEIMTGESDPALAARALLARGVGRVYVSLGKDGLLCGEGRELLHVPCAPARVLNTNGAGDAATAALVLGDLRGMSLRESGELAARAGALCCECREANSPRLRELLNEKNTDPTAADS